MGKKLLKMENITKEFPGVKALDKVYFDLEEGEVHVLIGENGAGKSTLVKILAGAYPKDNGKIYIEDQEVEINSPRDAFKFGINVIYQEFNLIPYMPIYENILLGKEYIKNKIFIDKNKAIKETKKILEYLGLNVSPLTLIQNLGVAEKQMVEIAKALMDNSKIIVFDEPTATLTDNEIDVLFDIIKTLKKDGKGIVYISHRLKEFEKIGDRCSVLRDGKYIGTINLDEFDEQKLIKMMVGRDVNLEQKNFDTSVTDQIVLEVRGLNWKEKVKNLSFSLKKGEILGVSGIVGAGRTEMAKAIIGEYQRESGDIYIKGKKVENKSPHEAINNGIFYLSEDRQNDGLFLEHNIKKNITISNLKKIINYGIISRKKEELSCNVLVNNLNIKTPNLETLTIYLSGGNQQKVIIGRALFLEASIYIFDEPTRGIDVGAKEEIYNIMRELVKSGGSIIMISSDLPEILNMSDRIMVISKGEISGIFENTPDLTQEKIISYAIGGSL